MKRLATCILMGALALFTPKFAFSQERVLTEGGVMGNGVEAKKLKIDELSERLATLKSVIKGGVLNQTQAVELITVWRQFSELKADEKTPKKEKAFYSLRDDILASVTLTKPQRDDFVGAGLLVMSKSGKKDVVLRGTEERPPEYHRQIGVTAAGATESEYGVNLSDKSGSLLGADRKSKFEQALADFYNGRPVSGDALNDVANYLGGMKQRDKYSFFGMNPPADAANPQQWVDQQIQKCIDDLKRGDLEAFIRDAGEDSQFSKALINSISPRQIAMPVGMYTVAIDANALFGKQGDKYRAFIGGGGSTSMLLLQNYEGRLRLYPNLEEAITKKDASAAFLGMARARGGVAIRDKWWVGAEAQFSFLNNQDWDVAFKLFGFTRDGAVVIADALSLDFSAFAGMDRSERFELGGGVQMNWTNLLGYRVILFYNGHAVLNQGENLSPGTSIVKATGHQPGIASMIPLGGGKYLPFSLAYVREKSGPLTLDAGKLGVTLFDQVDVDVTLGRQKIDLERGGPIPTTGGRDEALYSGVGLTWRIPDINIGKKR